MAARNDSGADWNSGKARMRSYVSSGMPYIVEAVSGDGRTGLDGFVSELKVRINDKASGTGAALDLAKVGVPDLWRRISIPLPVFIWV